MAMGASVTCVVSTSPEEAFDLFVEELTSALSANQVRFNPGSTGSLIEDEVEVARVVKWEPGRSILLEWKAPYWRNAAKASNVCIRFDREESGTRITLENPSWENLFDDTRGDMMGWFAGEVAGPFLQAMSPGRFGDWITDRAARRPSGAKARDTYRNPIYHRPNFLAILNTLRLKPDDYLVEIGCGGGAFLKDALASGCRAAAIDHSHEMVELAKNVNHDAIAAGRLIIHEAEADSLPFRNATFTCAVMTGVFGFLSDPVTVLTEINRVLTSGGRFVLFTSTKELKGTPAAPEPIASRLKFYEDDELKQLALRSGFTRVRVERPSFIEYAKRSGVPEEALALFSGREGQLLIAC